MTKGGPEIHRTSIFPEFSLSFRLLLSLLLSCHPQTLEHDLVKYSTCHVLRRVTSQIVDEGVNTLVSLLAIECAFLYFLVSQGQFFPRSFSCKENLVTMKMPSVFCRQTSPACFICFRTVSTVASITIIELLGRVRYTWSYRFIPT